MSGLEVAGVVLGAIPIVVAALELSVKGVSTLNKWRAYRRHIKNLIQDLETEHCKLENVLEQLLSEIARQDQIEEMIQNPFGPLWNDRSIQDRVQKRLWKSEKVFRNNVEGIKEAVDELKERLGIDGDFHEKVQDADLKLKFKRFSSFVVSGSACKDLLTRIKDNVDSLDKLMSQNARLEPKRQADSQGRFSKLVREMSRSIHEALRRSWRCQGSHNVTLQLEPRTAQVRAQDSDDDIRERLSFALGLSSQQAGDLAWEEVILRLALEAQESAYHSPILKKPSKSVRFSASSTSVSNQGASTVLLESTFSTLSLGSPYAPLSVPDIDNLCEIVCRAQKKKALSCYGRISDVSSFQKPPRKYSISPRDMPRADGGDWRLIPLSDVLSNKDNMYPPLSYPEKLRLAWIISSSVIQLQETPWMPNVVSIEDVFFISRQNQLSYRDVFVLSRMPDMALVGAYRNSIGVQNMALVALGILLVELKMGKPISALRPPNMEPSMLIDYDTALRQLDKVSLNNASLNYDTAVRRCLRCEFHQMHWSFEDDKFRQYVFDEVVANLEQDLKYIAMDMVC